VRRTIVSPKMSRLIGECRLTRNAAVRVLAGLYGELSQRYDIYKVFRNPEDSQRFFFFDSITDGDSMHTFTFHVDDSTSPDHLFVVDLEHQSRLRPI
jgi:hypothetical protein